MPMEHDLYDEGVLIVAPAASRTRGLSSDPKRGEPKTASATGQVINDLKERDLRRRAHAVNNGVEAVLTRLARGPLTDKEVAWHVMEFRLLLFWGPAANAEETEERQRAHGQAQRAKAAAAGGPDLG
jgi:hypothetical protein